MNRLSGQKRSHDNALTFAQALGLAHRCDAHQEDTRAHRHGKEGGEAGSHSSRLSLAPQPRFCWKSFMNLNPAEDPLSLPPDWNMPSQRKDGSKFLTCSCCSERLPLQQFSMKQAGKKDLAKCKSCVAEFMEQLAAKKNEPQPKRSRHAASDDEEAFMTDDAPVVCSGCARSLSRDHFSRRQLWRGSQTGASRCKTCLAKPEKSS